MTRLDIVHVLEATLGGTRQYVDDIVAASSRLELEDLAMGLVYAKNRADEGFSSTLGRVREAGWDAAVVDMGRPIRPVADLRAALRLRRVLARWRPRVLHCHSSKAGGIGRMAARLLVPRPFVVYSPHALAANIAWRYLAIERVLAGFTDRFVAISESERAEIAGFRVAPEARIEVVHPIVDSVRLRPRDRDAARAELGLADGPLVLGIGRFIKQKDPLAFLRVVERLRREVPDVRAVWIGAGELADAFDRERRARGLADVVTVERWMADVRPWIAAADAVLSVARFESFGYVVAEALAMERPVVASRVTGTVDVVRGRATRMLFERGDDGAAAALLRDVLRDPDGVSECVLDGACHVRTTFSAEAMAARLASAYDRTIGTSLAPVGVSSS